jgi:hypothetical protein
MTLKWLRWDLDAHQDSKVASLMVKHGTALYHHLVIAAQIIARNDGQRASREVIQLGIPMCDPQILEDVLNSPVFFRDDSGLYGAKKIDAQAEISNKRRTNRNTKPEQNSNKTLTKQEQRGEQTPYTSPSTYSSIDNTSVNSKSTRAREIADQPESLEECHEWIIRQGGTLEDSEAFFDHFSAMGWRNTNGVPIANWKARGKKWVRENQNKSEKVKSEW